MPRGVAGHGFHSRQDYMAGKCVFPLRRKPRRSKILVPFQGTSELLGRTESMGIPGPGRTAFGIFRYCGLRLAAALAAYVAA